MQYRSWSHPHFADCCITTVTPHPLPLPRHPFPLEMSIVLGLILGWGGGAFALPGRDTVSFDFGWKVSIIHFVLSVGLSQCEWDGVGAQCCFFHTPVHLPPVGSSSSRTHLLTSSPRYGGVSRRERHSSPTNPLTHSLHSPPFVAVYEYIGTTCALLAQSFPSSLDNGAIWSLHVPASTWADDLGCAERPSPREHGSRAAPSRVNHHV